MKNYLSFILLFAICSCMSPLEKGNIDISLDLKSEAKVNSINLSHDKLTLTGSGLDTVDTVKLGSRQLSIVSRSFNSISLSASSNINLVLNTALDLVINTAKGATTVPVVFNLVDGSVTASKLSDIGAGIGQVLRWNGTNWEAADLSGLTYAGNWNADSNSPDLSVGASLGHYYIVETAGSFDLSGGIGTNSWLVGDWAVWNDVASRWEKVANGSTVTKFNGRSGIVTPQAGDYTWAQINKTSSSINDLTDVNSVGATLNQVLKWNGSEWVPAADEVATAGSVTSMSIADDSIVDADISATANISQSKILNLTSTLAGKAPMPPTCTVGNKLLFDGINFSCVAESAVVDASKLPLAGGVMTGIINMNSQKIIGLANPTIASDAATKAYVDSVVVGFGSGDITEIIAGTGLTGGATSGVATLNVDVGVSANKIIKLDASAKLPAVDGSQLLNLPAQTDASKLPLTGGTLSGVLNMGAQYISNLQSPLLATDAANKSYVDSVFAGITAADIPTLDAGKITSGVLAAARIPSGTDTTKLALVGGTMTGAINMGANLVSNLAPPVAGSDAATKDYVDAAAPDLSDLKTKAAGTYNRENMSLEALREQLDLLKTEVDTVKTNQSNLSTDVAGVQTTVNTIGASAGAYTWQVASIDATISVGNAYAVSGANLLNFTLPATCSAGESLQLVSGGDKGYKIFANSGQSILYNGQIGGMVVTGFATITIICVADDTTWLVKNIEGSAVISKIGQGATSSLALTWFGASSNDFLDGNVSGIKGVYDSYTPFVNKTICAMINSEFYCMGSGAMVSNYSATKITGITDPKQVVYGSTSICVLENSGGVKCFGENLYGQLGDGTNTDSLNSAVQVIGLTSGVNKIVAGQNYACADHNNEIKCWGYNTNRSLGDGTTVHKNTPTTVSGMDNTSSTAYLGFEGTGVAIDHFFSNGSGGNCAIKSNRVYCWGSQVLYGTGSVATPSLRATLAEPILGIFCDSTACAFQVDAGSGGIKLVVYNWGSTSTTIQNISGTTSTEKIISWSGKRHGFTNGLNGNYASSGSSSCLVTDTNKLYCIGSDEYGQMLRSGTTVADNSSFIQLTGSFKKVISEPNYAFSFCAINMNDDLYCWGNNGYGQLGNGTLVSVTNTMEFILSKVKDFKFLSNDNKILSYALRENKLYTWGYATNATGAPVGYFPENLESGHVARPTLAKIDDETDAVGSFSYGHLSIIHKNAICFEFNGALTCSGVATELPSTTGVSVPFLYQ